MRLVEINAENFRMYKKFDLTLKNGENYIISGKNRTGKTTVAYMVS